MNAMKIDTELDNCRCGNLYIYPKLGQIKVAGKTIRLGPVNMAVLMTLIDNQGQVVSRAQIFDRVWKNQTVSDDTLTRCISDLRTQLGQYSDQAQLIETLPKRGYQWLPEVRPLGDSVEPPLIKNKSIHYIYRVLLGITALLILSTSVLWVANQIVRPDKIRIALIPIQTQQPSHLPMAADLEDLLHVQILKTNTLRFLSASAFASHSEQPFPYLSREFGTQWIIEGRIRQYQDKIRISLSLVDARTAIVSHTVTEDIDTSNPKLDDFCHLFIADVLRFLHL